MVVWNQHNTTSALEALHLQQVQICTDSVLEKEV